MKKIAFIAFATVIALSSCVSKKQYNDMLAEQQKYHSESLNANKDLADSNAKIKELNAENDRLKAEIGKLEADALKSSKEIYSLKEDIATLKVLNTELANQLGNSENEEEIKLLLADLQQLQESLQTKEDKLKKAENQLAQSQASLNEKHQRIEAQNRAIEEQNQKLIEQNQKLIELTELLDNQERNMKALKNKVSQALVGFEGNGLSVTNRDGKVYVSLDEQLLFKSGKWDVDPKGVTALQNLSKLLAENPDIQVLVEGHTDEIPYYGSGQILDNWDLSVKRATAIVRIILKNEKVNPARITAAGRSQYLPIDPAQTLEAQQKNRRTEIILSPKFDELMELLSK